MTKVTILGEPQGVEPKKKIEFLKYCANQKWENSSAHPHEYKNIELIARFYDKKFDLMFAYEDDRSFGCLYLGHFNDGIV